MRKLPPYHIYLILTVITALSTGMVYTALGVYYVTVAGLNPLQLVLVGTMLEATYMLFEVPTGVVADTYSRRLSIIIGMFVIAFAFVLQGMLPLFAVFLLAEGIRGIGETFLSGATGAWISDEIGEEQTGQLFVRGSQIGKLARLAGIGASALLGSYGLAVPVVAGGILYLLLGIFLVLFMPERGFAPAPRTGRNPLRSMTATFRSGTSLVRGKPLLIMLMLASLFWGASSEGFDRLWEAHLLLNITFPQIAGWQPIIWFSMINAVGLLLSVGIAEYFRRRLDLNDSNVLLRGMITGDVVQTVCVALFAFSGNFAVAVAALWIKSAARSVTAPYFNQWLVKNTVSQVRATVFSMSGMSNAFGQIAVGPAVGAIGTLFSLRVALAAVSGLMALPVFVYVRALRHGGQVVTAPVENTAGTVEAVPHSQ